MRSLRGERVTTALSASDADAGERETTHGSSSLARDVYEGLTSKPKRLPSYLFYDAKGSALYEQITELPEYYPTRTENDILTRYAEEIIEVATDDQADLSIAELGAGTSSKSVVILRALVDKQGECVYVPTDVSRSALALGAARIGKAVPEVVTRPCVGLHEQAFEAIAQLGGHRMVLFIGSSIGNLSDAEATKLLSGLRRHLEPGCFLLLGTDMKKSETVLVPAYDDSQGITARFNKNALSHLNQALRAEFDVSRFKHVALWNEAQSRIEMHLESITAQDVPIHDLGIRVSLAQGERIHTESSVKYDAERVDEMLCRSGFERVRTYTDSRQWFGVHLARAA